MARRTVTRPNIDLPLYFADMREPFRHLAWYGGRGGGKSRTVATGLVMQACERHERILCGREFQKSIRDSSKRLIDDEIDRLGLRPAFTSTETEIRGPHDSLFLFAGIRSNASGLKSMEGLTTFWGDEAQAFSQGSIDTIIPTIRREGSRLIWTWNPDLPTDPVDAVFRGNHLEDGETFEPPPGSIVREINFNQNKWFPQVLRTEMEFVRSRDIDKYNHIWLGQYRANSEARVFRNWKVEEFDSDPGAEYRIGADFGYSIDPSCALRCYLNGRQLFVDYEAWGLKVEIVNLPALFMSIPGAEKYWMTADSSRPETISHLRRNGFPRIASALKGPRSVEEGIEFLKSYDIVVHPRCQHVIDELTHYSYKVDSLTGQVTAVLADKDNHCVAEGSLVTCERGLVPIECVTLNDRVLTRRGYRDVLFADVTDVNRSILEVVTSVGIVRCTPDHEIWTELKGMVRADALRYGDIVLGDGSWRKSSNGTASDTGVTRTAAGERIASIISAPLLAGLARSIGTFGSTTTGQSQMGAISTTSTAIRSTTKFPTSRASIRARIVASIRGMMSGVRGKRNIWTRSAILRKLGTAAKKGLRSIARSARSPIVALYPSPSLANNAGRYLSLVRSGTSTASVPTNASPLGAGRRAWMTSAASARVANRSGSTDTASPALVRGRVLAVREAGQCKRVYDLTVAEHHEFFADGVLVSNCIDALRYAVEGARRALNAQAGTHETVAIPTLALRR